MNYRLTELKVLLFLLLLSAVSCQRPMYDEEDDEDGVSQTNLPLKISARSSGESPINYPAYIYAFAEDGMRSDTARLMLANSEFLVMLNQSATDRAELAKLLNISDNQLGYVTNVPAGCGLIRCAGNIVPFTNSFPKDTKLYKLMSTNPSEKRE